MDNTIMNYIVDNCLILIPFLSYIGYMIKNTEEISDKYIPIVLSILGIISAMLLLQEFSIEAVIQGVLVSGASVLGNQLIKQYGK